MRGLIDVYFVLLPDSLILDWAGPAEALRIANLQLQAQGQRPRFQLHFVGPLAETRTSVGAMVGGLAPLPLDLQGKPDHAAWIVLIGLPGPTIDVSKPTTQSCLRWLRTVQLQAGQLELVTICAGTLLAAHAGLLGGRRVTTHHDHLGELQQTDIKCEVLGNRIFVSDPPVHSSAGVTTGIDLMLHRIAETCGEVIAARVAQSMVVALRRGPHDPQLSPFLAYRHHLHPALHRVQDAVSSQPREDWTVTRMADVAHTSARHLTRLFMLHAHIAPLQYLRRIRLAVAHTALQAGHSVTQAADIAGYHSDTQLRRAWQQLGQEGTPSQARAQPLSSPR